MSSIDDIVQRLDRLEQKNKENFLQIEKRLTSLESSDEDVETDDVEERIKEIEDLQMLLELENISIKEQLEDKGVKDPVMKSSSNSKINELKKRVDELEKKSPGFLKSKNNFKPIKRKLSSLEERINKLSLNKPDKLKKRVDSLEKMVKDSGPKDTDLSPIRERINDLEERISSMNGSNVSLDEKELNELKEKIDGMESKDFSEAERIARENEKRISKLKESINQNGSEGGDFSKLRDDISNLKKRFNETEGGRVDVNTDEIENKIEKNREMINQVFDKIKKVKDNKNLDLKSKVDKLEKRVSSMPRKITSKDDTGPEKIREEMNKKIQGLRREIEKVSNKPPSSKLSQEKLERLVEKKINSDLLEFSKTLDKKLESHVDKMDINKIHSRLNNIQRQMDSVPTGEEINNLEQQIRQVRSPNLSPLISRINDLDEEIQRLDSIMQNLGNRVPTVLE